LGQRTSTFPPFLTRTTLRTHSSHLPQTYLLEHYFPNIKVYVYDFDSTASASPLLGPVVSQSLLATVGKRPYLSFIARSTEGKSFADIAHEVIEERVWASVVINANATTAFQAATAGTGGLIGGMWSPEGAISVVVSSSRWYQVVLECTSSRFPSSSFELTFSFCRPHPVPGTVPPNTRSQSLSPSDRLVPLHCNPRHARCPHRDTTSRSLDSLCLPNHRPSTDW
jgi:hypothetical protein